MNRSIPVLITAGLMTCVCLLRHAISGIRLMEVLQKFHLGSVRQSFSRPMEWIPLQAGGIKDNLCCVT